MEEGGGFLWGEGFLPVFHGRVGNPGFYLHDNKQERFKDTARPLLLPGNYDGTYDGLPA